MYTTNVFAVQDFNTKLIMKHDFKCTLDSSKSYQFSLNKQNYILSKSPVVKFALDWQKTQSLFLQFDLFFCYLCFTIYLWLQIWHGIMYSLSPLRVALPALEIFAALVFCEKETCI